MRAISLWQPWASAIAIGSKLIETRHWATDYRGPIAIHAARRKVLAEFAGLGEDECWIAAMHPLLDESRELDANGSLPLEWHNWLPFGCVVAVAELVDCIPTNAARIYKQIREPRTHKDAPALAYWTEWDMGNFEPGRFAWLLSSVRALPSPVPFVGKQGFFSVPDELLQVA